MKIRIPHTYVLLFFMVFLLGIASYFISAGSFDRDIDEVRGIEYVVPGSYHTIPKTPVSIFGIFKAIPEGALEASDIIIFVLITGGSFGIINATGSIYALMGSIVRSFVGRERYIIPMVMFVFSIAGTVFGTAEEALPLYPIFISLALALGFDKITGVAMVLLGTGAGFAAGVLNPFTTGIAQGISELPLFSGIVFRIFCYFVIVSASILYVTHYASKIHGNPSQGISIYNDVPERGELNLHTFAKLTARQKYILWVLILYFVFLMYGILKLKFLILEIATTFLLMGITCGVVGKLSSGRIASEFVKGASSMIYGALIIGLARAIMVVMVYGNILDTVIFRLSNAIKDFPTTLSATSMFFVQTIINLFITSGSGQAAATMPIMSALADMSGVTRQTAILAFQFGDGFSNIITPTSGYFMAALALGGIEWKKWFKWVLPLFIIWSILGCILLSIAVAINYGPF